VNPGAIEFSPAWFSDAIEKLWASINEFHIKMQKFELNVLRIERSGETLSLMLQYVRKKIVRVGMYSDLIPSANDAHRGANFFGLKPQVFNIFTSVSGQEDPLECINRLATTFNGVRACDLLAVS
jgi:hypothetical protein